MYVADIKEMTSISIDDVYRSVPEAKMMSLVEELKKGIEKYLGLVQEEIKDKNVMRPSMS